MELAIKIKDSDNNTEFKKILTVLAFAKSPAPLGYISLHTGIKEPLKILEKLEEEGLVRRSPSSTWSCSRDPNFEIACAAQKQLSP